MEDFSLQRVDLQDIDGHGRLLQTGFWGAMKSDFGWQAYPFTYTLANETHPLLVLVKPLGMGYSLAYVPHGPVVYPATEREQYLAALSKALKKELPRKCVFIRFDLLMGTTGEDEFPSPLKAPLRKATMDIQPPDTVVLNIDGEEDAILKQMKPKWRYNIRLAAKKGVEVFEAAVEDLDSWYDMYQVTAERDKITLHKREYYRALFDLAAQYGKKAPKVKLLLAKHEDDILAGIIIALHGTSATYLYGASTNEKRNLMPAYALQWQAIQIAKAEGCRDYDFFGIPPENDKNHPMYGLYRFKTGFGGTIHHRLGCWDYPLKGGLYNFFRAAENLRRWYYRSFRKR